MTSSRYESAHHRGDALPGHRHQSAYLALVQAGAYLEYSADGAFRCQAGMAIVHPAFHLHGNHFAGIC